MADDWVMMPPKEEEEEDDWELLDNDYDETLREERTPFYSDLKDPEMERLLIASTMAEVGDQGPEAAKAYIESVMNRSRARNMPLAETITDPNYYPGTTLSRLGQTHEGPRVQQLRRTIMEVVSGSNLSGYATGNESGNVHSGGAPVSYDPKTGERFVQENPDKEWVEQISTRGTKAKEPDDWEIISASAPKEPDDWEIIPPGGKLEKPTGVIELTPNQTRTKTNRDRLSTAIADVEKAGYTVPHFIGTENEPEGDRGPTRDMESLTKALALQEENAIRGGNTTEAAKIRQDRAYWEEKIKTEGMSAEQWKKQTGEEDPRYPHEPAFQAKQSPEGLIDTVETGINAGKEFFASIPRGLMGAGIGLGETVNRYAYSPIIHGLREAIDYVAPDTGLSKFAKYVDDEFYKNTVEIPAQQREQLGKESAKAGTAGEIGHAVGTMVGDLPTIMLTSGLLPELKTGMELVNSLRHGAAAMTVPAMRAGTDAAAEVKKNGGGEAEQFGAWVKATTIMLGIGAVPMATKSGAATKLGRFAERGAKTVPLASASVEAARLGENLLSSLTGGEQRPFSLEENIKATIPMVILGGFAGRDTRPSKFERTYGFNERNLEKAEWMRKQMEAEGIAKATPEKVMEWEAKWKEQEGQWPEEAEPKTSAAPQNIAQVGQGGKAIVSNMYDMLFKKLSKGDLTELGKPSKILHEANVAYQAGKIKSPEDFQKWANTESSLAGPQPVKKSPQALGIVASPKATPEKVMEWEAKWKEQEGEWPEEAPPVAPEAPAAMPGGEITLAPAEAPAPKAPLPRIPHDFLQAKLGIVANPKAVEGFAQAGEEAKAISDYLNQHDLHFGRAGLGQWEAQHREAWHGTNADIEEFSHEAMGTGTGGQVQGYGSYVAQAKGTAKYYQQVTTRGKGTEGNLYKVKVVGDEANYLDWDKPFNKQSEDVKEVLGPTVKEMNKGRLPILEERLNKVNEDLKRYTSPEYTEFTPEGKASLIRSANDYIYELKKDIAKIKAGPTGEDIYKYLSHKFGINPATGGLVARGDQVASEWLYKQGVIGNRYLDAESRYPVILQNDNTGKWFAATKDPNKLGKVKEYDTRQEALDRAKEEGTSNYVVFNPKNIRITDKNGNPVQAIRPSPQALGIVASPKATKGFEQAKEEAKNIADFLNKAEHWGPWNSALGNLVAGRQKATDQVKKQAEALKKLAPDAEARKGITMWIEADGDVKKLAGWGANTTHAEGREAYRQAGALKPNEVAVAEKIKARYQALRMEATARGIDIAEMDNYITHLLARSEVPGTGRKGLSSFFRFAKPRTYDTFFQALKGGEKPKTLDAVDILSVYEITLQNAIKNKMFVDRLKYGEARDGRPILAKSSVKQTPEGKDYSKELQHLPGLERVVVHPDHVKDLGRILGRSRIQEKLEERSRNPFVNIGKGLLRMGLEGQKYAKGTMFSLSLFHQLTEGTHAVGHRINPFNLKTKAIDLSDPKQYDAAKHGVMLRPDKVSQNMFMEGVGSDNYNLVTKVTRKFGGEAGKRVADLVDGYSHYLFESYIPRLKMDTYNHILERNMGRFAKDLKSGKVSTSEVKSLSADQANAAYGHLNYTKMARSPTVQHLLQIALLAPDFFEARARFAAQAGKGAVGLLTGSKTGTEQLIALSLLGIGQYVTARILNQLDHGDSEWDPEHAFQVKTDLGGILPDDRWVGLRSVPEDLHKAATDAGQFFQNRLSPFARLAAENVFKTNWRHEKTDFAQTIRDMLGNIVPLPLQGFTESISRPGKAHSLSTLEMIYKSTGIQIHRVSPINDAFQFADDWLKKNNPEEWARKEASAFPESRYRPLRFAIEDGDEQGARAEAKKLFAQGDIGKKFAQSMLRPFTGSYANDQRLYDSLDKYDKKVFDAALKRRTLVLDRYRAWVGPLPRIETEDTLHEKMRKAKVKDIKERLAQGLVEEET